MKLRLVLLILLSASTGFAQDITYYKAYESFLPKDFITNINQKQVFHERVKQIGSIDPTLVYLYIERFNTRADNRMGYDEMINLGLRATIRKRQEWLKAELEAFDKHPESRTEDNRMKVREVIGKMISATLPDSGKSNIALPATPKLAPQRYHLAIIYLKGIYEPYSELVNYENQYRYLVEEKVSNLNAKREKWLTSGSVSTDDMVKLMKPMADFWTMLRPWEYGQYWYPIVINSSWSGARVEDSGPGVITRMAQALESYLYSDTIAISGFVSGGLSTPVEFSQTSKMRAYGQDYTVGADQGFYPFRLGVGASFQWKAPEGQITLPFSVFRFQASTGSQSVTEMAYHGKSAEITEKPIYEWNDEIITEQKRSGYKVDYAVTNWSISTTFAGYGWAMADLGFRKETLTLKNSYRHELILTHNRYKSDTGSLIASSVYASQVDRLEDLTRTQTFLYVDLYMKTPWYTEFHVELSKKEPVFFAAAVIPLIPFPFY
ncbi:MAG: hypothetical protein HUU10_14405 [Bacteroidetes bacterium]|nr:hypothetical protein [Bacteroidota bacterium]